MTQHYVANITGIKPKMSTDSAGKHETFLFFQGTAHRADFSFVKKRVPPPTLVLDGQ
jgi:hypothetical protein